MPEATALSNKKKEYMLFLIQMLLTYTSSILNVFISNKYLKTPTYTKKTKKSKNVFNFNFSVNKFQPKVQKRLLLEKQINLVHFIK